jgi:hypothetical protein
MSIDSLKGFMKLNQKGLSLPEILISLGVMGAVGLGVASLMTQSAKKNSEMHLRLGRMTMEKTVENYFYSDAGCSILVGKKVGDVLSLSAEKFPEVKAKTQLKELKFTGFSASDDKGIRGIAKLNLTLEENGIQESDKRIFVKEIPVPVNMKLVGGVNQVEDCRLNKSHVFSDIVSKVCEGTFGTMTKGMSCADAIALVESSIMKEICADIYGAKGAQFNDINCDIKQIHSNKSCGAGVAVGFDHEGKILCQALPASLPSTPGPPSAPTACSSWSSWLPGAENACPTESVTQTRSCLDGGSSLNESRIVSGIKSCGGDCVIESPLTWENFDEKVGMASCVDITPVPITLRNYQGHNAVSVKGAGPPGEPKAGASGGMVVQCVSGVVKIISSACAIITKNKVCPKESTYCSGKPANSGGAVYSWGYLKYGLPPSCAQVKEVIGNHHFTHSELQAGMREGCPPPFGDSNVDE